MTTSSRRALVLFYSRSETTARLARQLADELGADCERLHEIDEQRRAGPVGYLRSLVHVLAGRSADLLPTLSTIAAYQLVVIGTPVWAGRVCIPVATWLARHGRDARATALFCTMGASGDAAVFAQMQALIGQRPLGSCAFLSRDVRRDAVHDKLTRFARTITDRLAERQWQAHAP
ncbi:flavodoxin family protein [Burkholderia glumae]|uniref:flavodoxin family protein n=1 Tax=Burkholderia glumae TaxID=337 RepID=UPI00054ABEDC|nr:flavodoxin [Burkholderia glumae]KHJ60324.1 flavodoxin [Burkholderia glumae]